MHPAMQQKPQPDAQPGNPQPAAPQPQPQPQPGGMQPGAGGPGGPGGGADEQMMQLAQQHMDPNNPLQQLLLQRLDSLSPQEGEALVGMGPQAGEALKKVLPEIAFLIDMMVMGQAPGGGMDDAGQPGMQPAGMGAGGGQPAPQMQQPPGGGTGQMPAANQSRLAGIRA